MSDNLKLWALIEKTDPTHVKEITGKAYRGNSPKPHWIIWKATETFGPTGIGWGFSIVEEKLLDGALLEPGFYERIHMARVKVWYIWEGQRGEVEHVGQTVFSGRRKASGNNAGAPFTDEDAPKKSVTDALVKALSLIGFAGDIFMGLWDDSRYVADLKHEAADAKREAQKAKQAEKVVPLRPAAENPLIVEGNAAAARGKSVFVSFWKRLNKGQRETIGTEDQLAAWKVMSEQADARRDENPFDDMGDAYEPPFDEANYARV